MPRGQRRARGPAFAERFISVSLETQDARGGGIGGREGMGKGCESNATTPPQSGSDARTPCGCAGGTLISNFSTPAGPSPRHFWTNTPATHRTAGASAVVATGLSSGSLSQHDGFACLAQQDFG